MSQRVRGSTVEPARRFAMQKRGTPAWQTFVDSLDHDQRALLEQPILKRQWYDLRTYSAFITRAAETLGGDDPESFLFDAGRFVFSDGVNSVYRAFFRVASPVLIVRASTLIWRLVFSDTQLKVIRARRHEVSTAIVGGDFCTHYLCISIAGGMQSALEHAGARNVHLQQHNCRAAGAARCEFHFTWS